jgi:S1-C subfamily serine protease
VLVVLVGSGHVAYGLGIERQARPALGTRIASVIPVPIRVHGDAPPLVRASYATYVWGVPAEMADAYPALGISTRRGDGGLVVLVADPETPGGKAGVEAGDILVSFDGTPLQSRAALSAKVAEQDWGDVAALVVRRGGELLTLRIAFTRALPRVPAHR